MARGFDLIHPIMEAALRNLGVTAEKVTQTVGRAAASKGFHKAEGKIQGHAYSSCVDLSWSLASKAFKSRMVEGGFAPFFRHTGSFAENRHIHAVCIGLTDDLHQCRILPGPRQQIIDATRNLNGLVGHAPIERDYRFTDDELGDLRSAYTAWAPDFATQVLRPDGLRIKCYAFLEQRVVRCEARVLLEALGARVVWSPTDQTIHASKDVRLLDLSGAELELEGGQFMRGNVRQLAEACGYAVVFAWNAGGASATVSLTI